MDNSFQSEEDDMMDLTDTESSSSSNPGIFEVHQPFVLELHNIRKDDPMPPENVIPPAKLRKHRKKKKGLPVKDRESHSSLSSDSISEASSVTPSATDGREEFYDAHESYHAIPENQAPVVAAARLQAHSETSQNPKIAAPSVGGASEQTTTTTTTTATAKKEPSTVTKPTVPPEPLAASNDRHRIL